MIDAAEHVEREAVGELTHDRDVRVNVRAAANLERGGEPVEVDAQVAAGGRVFVAPELVMQAGADVGEAVALADEVDAQRGSDVEGPRLGGIDDQGREVDLDGEALLVADLLL